MKQEDTELIKSNDNPMVVDFIDKERNILAKSKILKLSNLANKMTPTQNAIFSLALRNVEIDGDSAVTEVPISELLELLPDSSYVYFDKRIISRDKKAIQENHIDLIDEKFFNNDPNGKAISIGIFSYFNYERGKFVGVFNTTPYKGKAYILDVLKSQEVNPLVYNLKTFSELSPSGQVLYEELLILSGQDIRSVKCDLEELKQLFRVNGKSMNRFYTINQKHLKDAIAEINEKTDMNLIVNQIKEGRAVVGIELVWSIEKVKLQATHYQQKTLNELFVQLQKLNPTEKNDSSLLRKLGNPHLVSKQEAQVLISKAIERVKSLRNELELEQELSSESESLVVADLDKVKEVFHRVTKKGQSLLVKALQEFPIETQDEILSYVLHLAKQNNAKSINYVITILNEWTLEGIQTEGQARALHDDSYGETLPDLRHVEASDDFLRAMDLWKD